MSEYALTTRLEAVNAMLSAIGAQPTNSLTGSVTPDVADAQNILDEAAKRIQQRGWHFNTEHDVTLPRAADNTITLSDNILRVDEWEQGDYDVVQRGTQLYDAKNHTNTWTQSIKASVVYALDWDQLPEPARTVIFSSASRVFIGRKVGQDTAQYRDAVANEGQAAMDLMEHEGDTADHSIFDHWDFRAAVTRQSPLNQVL